MAKSNSSPYLEKAGFKNIIESDSKQAPGLGIHEMGTARMGNDPKSSVLNAHNQVLGRLKCICYLWCLHDLRCMSESVAHLHGHYGKGS